MLKLIKIAITGGVASGKSTVCQFFKELGANVVSADAIVHELLQTDTNLIEQMVQLLGPEILQKGKISRKIVAQKAFADRSQLKKIEELIHPKVFKRIEDLYKEACNREQFTSFVVEIPLLFEIGAETLFDVIVVVLSDKSKAIKRFEQAGFQKTDYDLRMYRQLTPEQKAAKADYIIQNNSSLDFLQSEVIKLNKIIHNQ